MSGFSLRASQQNQPGDTSASRIQGIYVSNAQPDDGNTFEYNEAMNMWLGDLTKKLAKGLNSLYA